MATTYVRGGREGGIDGGKEGRRDTSRRQGGRE